MLTDRAYWKFHNDCAQCKETEAPGEIVAPSSLCTHRSWMGNLEGLGESHSAESVWILSNASLPLPYSSYVTRWLYSDAVTHSSEHTTHRRQKLYFAPPSINSTDISPKETGGWLNSSQLWNPKTLQVDPALSQLNVIHTKSCIHA